jgi:hypothetical protein
MLRSKTNLAGEGVGYLTKSRRQRETINEFVAKILAQFPPQQ